MTKVNNSRKLKELILSDDTLIVPDAYDAISATLIEKSGFQAVQCSGYSISLAQQINNEKELTFENNLHITNQIIKATNLPVIADGENGYGTGQVLINTINSYIEIGTAGINIEDQNFDKTFDERIINSKLMLEKIKIIKDTIKNFYNKDFVLNARTDALLNSNRKLGQKIAIERANKYFEHGADLLFICYAQTYEEIELFSKEIVGPISIAVGQPYNYNNFSIKDCQDLGIARVSLPTYIIFNSMQQIYNDLLLLKNDMDFSILRKEKKISSDILNILNNQKG